MAGQNHTREEHSSGVMAERRHQPMLPSQYKVLLHNDDYTSQDFVVLILQSVFHKSEAEATQIMLQVHYQGIGIAGIYPYEIAETKVAKVHSLAKQHEFPLQCTLEQD